MLSSYLNTQDDNEADPPAEMLVNGMVKHAERADR